MLTVTLRTSNSLPASGFGCGRFYQVVPVGLARGVPGEIELEPVEKHGVHDNAFAEQRQQLNLGAGTVNARKGFFPESRRVAEFKLAGLDADPGEERPAKFALDAQLAAGVVLDSLDDLVLVVVGVEQQRQGDAEGDKKAEKAANQDSQYFQGFIQGAASRRGMERVMGIEPTLVAWEATVLPLNYTRMG